MHYLYKFVNKNDEVIYIGITGDIKKRIQSQHFGGSGHLPEECYEEALMVLYVECVSKDDASVKERYFINKEKPMYNDKLKNDSAFSFTIDEPEWKYMAVSKKDLLNKKVKSKKHGLRMSELKDSKLNPGTQAYKSRKGETIKIKSYKADSLVIGGIGATTDFLGSPLVIDITIINGNNFIFLESFTRFLSYYTRDFLPYSSDRRLPFLKDLLHEDVVTTEDTCLVSYGWAIVPTFGGYKKERNKECNKNILIRAEKIVDICEYLSLQGLNKYEQEITQKGNITFCAFTREGKKEFAFDSVNQMVAFQERFEIGFGYDLKKISTLIEEVKWFFTYQPPAD